jgi:DNA-binding CsgD family transcriptional regulator
MDMNHVVAEQAPLRVKRAFTKFLKQITPNHSLSSRRFSIFTLMRNIIDPEINALVMDLYMSNILPGFHSICVSDMWSESRPIQGINELHMWVTSIVNMGTKERQSPNICKEKYQELVVLQQTASWDSFIKLKDIDKFVESVKEDLPAIIQSSRLSLGWEGSSFQGEKTSNFFHLQDRIENCLPSNKTKINTRFSCELDRRISNADSWLTYFDQATTHTRLTRRSIENKSQILGTLTTLRNFVEYCNELKPKKVRTPKGRAVLQIQQIKFNRGNMLKAYEHEQWFERCSMCYKPTVFTVNAATSASKLPTGQVAYQTKISGSKKYCSDHDPADPASSYRKDLKRRDAFLQEVAAYLNRGESSYKLHLNRVTGVDEEARRAAFSLVQSRLKGNKENVLILLSQGIKQADIARQLGISPQAVSKIKVSLPTEIDIIHRTLWFKDRSNVLL